MNGGYAKKRTPMELMPFQCTADKANALNKKIPQYADAEVCMASGGNIAGGIPMPHHRR
jgi:hypothetical protein